MGTADGVGNGDRSDGGQGLDDGRDGYAGYEGCAT